ncbi:MAG: Chloride/fluoride channel protein [Eubacteriales bacterium]|jgi:H+/Cl- antiporter ClcA
MGLAAEKIKQQGTNLFKNIGVFLKWILLSCLTGGVVGLVGAAFSFCLKFVTGFRTAHMEAVYFLPFAGIAIVFLYHACKVTSPQGTNLVLLAVRSTEEVPLRMAPLIFVSTCITHLFGGSAGREGAALQIGGSLGFQMGRLFRLDEKDLHIMTMCGMSAAFSALFGTPLTSAIFAMEVISVGIMYYAALVPCVTASLVGAAVADSFGVAPTAFSVTDIPAPEPAAFLRVILLAALCAGVSVLLCYSMKYTGEFFQKKLKNPYLRAAAGGAAVVLLMLVFGTDYLGAGMESIENAMNGTAKPEAFLLKILFTAVTLGVGFKGGEIVPSFFAGATFGCVAGGLIGLSPSFGASVGLMAVFCGVTNCPLTSLVLSIELFGAKGAAFYLLAAAVSYMLSGYTGLYSRQKIMYSKFRPEYIGNQRKA